MLQDEGALLDIRAGKIYHRGVDITYNDRAIGQVIREWVKYVDHEDEEDENEEHE